MPDPAAPPADPKPEPTPAAAPPADPKPAASTTPPAENLIGEAVRKQKVAEKEAADAKAKLEQLEADKLSELEKAQKRAERAEQKATELEQQAAKAQRESLLRNAAQAAKFEDPEDAIVFLAGEDIVDKDAAEAAVKQLAERKPKLLGGEPGPTPIGGLTTQTPPGQVPVGPDGKPDYKAGLAKELATNLLGPRQ